jgi:hypothetical protein
VVLFALLTAYYIANNAPRTFVALAVIGMLAMLDRYLGAAAIATGVVCVVFRGGGQIMQRLLRGSVLSLAALPAGIWFLLTSPLAGGRAPISLAENLQWFSRSLLEWFLPAYVIEADPALYIALLWILVLGSVALLFSARHAGLPSFAGPILLYGLLYLLALFGSASITYFNKLGGRLLLPLYLPCITLLLVCAQVVLDRAKRASPRMGRAASIGVFGVLGVVALLSLRISIPVVVASHEGKSGVNDNDFNTAEWHANTALEFWRTHPPEGRYLLFSNYPDAIAFYTQHACSASPRQYSGPYGTVEFPVEGYTGQLFSPGEETYLIWIEPNESDYYYSPGDLRSIALLQRLFANSDGAVYRLDTKPGN